MVWLSLSGQVEAQWFYQVGPGWMSYLQGCWVPTRFLLKAGVVVFLENLNFHRSFRDGSWSAPLMVPWVSSFLVTGGRVLWITDLLDRRALGACLNRDWLTG